MKRKLSSQAIKAMAIGMAFSVTSTTIASGVNVYADSLTNEETTQNNGVSVLPVFPSEEVTEDTPVVLPELPQADTPVVLPSFPSEDTDSIPATPIETVDTLEVSETYVYSDVDAVNQAIGAASKGEELVIDLKAVTDFSTAIEILSGKNVKLINSDNDTITNLKINVNGVSSGEEQTTLTIDNLKITSTEASPSIEVTGKNNNLILNGTNTFTGKANTSTEAIKVDVTGENNLTLTGNGNLTIQDYKVGIGSSGTTINNNAKGTLTVNATGTINLQNITDVGIGYKTNSAGIASTYQTIGTIENTKIDLTINSSKENPVVGISVKDINNANITGEVGHDREGSNSDKNFNAGIVASSMKNSTVNITVNGHSNFNAPNTAGYIRNIDSCDIKCTSTDNYNNGIWTTNISNSKVFVDGNASGNEQGGIRLYYNEALEKGTPKTDFRISNTIFIADELKDNKSDKYSYLNRDIFIQYRTDSSSQKLFNINKENLETELKEKNPIQNNFLRIKFNESISSDYTNLTVNGKLISDTVNTSENGNGISYYIFDIDSPIVATVEKDGKKYKVLDNEGKDILNAQPSVEGSKEIFIENAKISQTPMSDDEVSENIFVTNEFGKYEFKINENKKTVTLVNFTNNNSSEKIIIDPSAFVSGTLTTGNKTYILTEIGNGSTALSNITDTALAGHTNNVTKVNDNAFTNNKNITNVNLPKATSIGANSFKGTNIQQANYPEVTSVGSNAFDSTPNLSNVNLPKVENVGNNAFANSSVVSADLGSKVPNNKPVSIPNNAFNGSNNLNTIQTNSNSTSQSGANGSAQNSGSNNVVIKDENGNSTGTVTPPTNNGGGSTGGSSGGGGANIGTTNTNNSSTENNTNTNTENNNNNNNSTVVEDKTLSLDVISLPSVTGEPKVFADVASNHWAKAHIDKLSTAGIISGDQNGNFNLNGQTKRADVTIMLVKLLGLTPETNTKFNDVDPNAYYAAYVGAASNYGIVNGSNGNFNPNGIISRQDTMVMIAQILKGLNLNVNTDTSNLTQFSDVSKISPYANESVAILVNSGIITGNNGKLNPTAPVTRAEMATIMSKLYDVLDSAK